MDGEFLSLLGPSGCGKSTALNIMGGLLSSTSGTVVFDGKPVSGPSRDIGMMFQQAVMFPWRTTLENVLLPVEVFGQPKKKYRAKAEELLVMVGIRSSPGRTRGSSRVACNSGPPCAGCLIHEPEALIAGRAVRRAGRIHPGDHEPEFLGCRHTPTRPRCS